MAARQSITDRPIKPCLVCGSPIQGKPSYVAKRTYCGHACRIQHWRGEVNPNWKGGEVAIDCWRCRKTFYVIRAKASEAKFCGAVCRDAAVAETNRGPNNPRWMGGHRAAMDRYQAKIKHQRIPKPPKMKVEPPPRKERDRVVRICRKCGLPGVKKSCSFHPECSPQREKKSVIIACEDCGARRKAYLNSKVMQRRCRECEFKHRSGPKNGRWKGGITPANRKFRASPEYKAWRTSVFQRDSYTCVWCGQRGGTLHADHIKPFSLYPELRLELSNGRTLCVECHKCTDSYLNKQKALARSHRKSGQPGQLTFEW